MKNDATPNELEIFYYLHYGHLITACLQLSKWWAEHKGYTFFANSIQLSTLFTYLTPLFFGQWCLQNVAINIFEQKKKRADLEWTPVREWIALEENLLVAQVYFGIIFVVVGSFTHLDSFWNKAGVTKEMEAEQKKTTVFHQQSSQ